MGSTPSSGIPVPPESRWLSAGVFVATGVIAVAAGVSLAVGAAPMLAAEAGWLTAYLILIAGAAQIALGVGQAWLAAVPVGFERGACEWGAINLGNIGILAGSLLGSFWVVVAGTAAFVLALALFALGVRRTRHPRWRIAYAALIAFLAMMALVGLALAAAQFRA